MVGHRLSAVGLVLTIMLYGCAGISGVESYVNKKYQSKSNSVNKLAIVPLTHLGPSLACTGKCPPLEQVTDESFEKSFGELSGKIFILPMVKTRVFFSTNTDLLKKLLDITYSRQDLDNDPGLQKTLDGSELASLRERLEGADLLLVPARFDLVPQFGSIFGNSEFRLYDLHSGSLIYSSSEKINVNRSDEPGRGLTALVLISKAKEAFEKFYLRQ